MQPLDYEPNPPKPKPDMGAQLARLLLIVFAVVWIIWFVRFLDWFFSHAR